MNVMVVEPARFCVASLVPTETGCVITTIIPVRILALELVEELLAHKQEVFSALILERF